MKHIKTTFIGGDLRQVSAAGYFSGIGAEARVWGFEKCRLPDGVTGYTSFEEACDGADAIILPLPYGKDGEINCPMTEKEVTLAALLNCVDEKTVIMGGRLDEKAYSLAAAHNNKIIDYYGREELSVNRSIISSITSGPNEQFRRRRVLLRLRLENFLSRFSEVVWQ